MTIDRSFCFDRFLKMFFCQAYFLPFLENDWIISHLRLSYFLGNFQTYTRPLINPTFSLEGTAVEAKI